jgi:hypothetical protein
MARRFVVVGRTVCGARLRISPRLVSFETVEQARNHTLSLKAGRISAVTPVLPL